MMNGRNEPRVVVIVERFALGGSARGVIRGEGFG